MWGSDGRGLVVGSQDIYTAVDELVHEVEDKSLAENGAHPVTRAALFRVNVGVAAKLEAPQTGQTRKVHMQQGCVQGMVDVPERFRSLLNRAIKEAQRRWAEGDHGVKVEGVWATRLVWADNVSRDSYNKMAQVMTEEIEKLGVRWKKASMGIMWSPFGDKEEGGSRVWSGRWGGGMVGQRSRQHARAGD